MPKIAWISIGGHQRAVTQPISPIIHIFHTSFIIRKYKRRPTSRTSLD
jgi:hypothetical protein